MRHIKYLLILSILAVSCKVEHQNRNSKTALVYHPNKTPLISYLVYDSILDKRYFDHGIPTVITTEDSIQIEKLLNDCITEENKYAEQYFEKVQSEQPHSKLIKENFILILSRYKRQYMAIINPYGDKEIWVNCFCEYWNAPLGTRPVQVSDGGNCFFNLKINLSKNRYYNLMINGDA